MKLLLLALAACATNPDPATVLYDPTGTWDLTLRWGQGSCGATGSDIQLVLVTEIGGEFVADTTNANETTSGTVALTETSATLDITIENRDPLGDGGSAFGTLTIRATADSQQSVTGQGQVAFTGSVVCSQQHTLIGVIR